MAIQTINLGAAPNDGNGDDLRTAMGKINANFSELSASGLDYTGATDSTSALQAVIDEAGANAIIRLGAGVIKITSPLLIANHRVHVIGAGTFATKILFAPTADGACFQVVSTGNVVYQGSFRGFTIYSNDSTYTKTAIDLIDISTYTVEDVVIGGSIEHGNTFYFSGGTGSVGLRTRGREALHCNRVMIAADLPIVMMANPNYAYIGVDHFHFENMYLIGHDNPLITVADGCQVGQLTFDGYQIWAKGTYGFALNTPSSIAAHHGIKFCNVRREQAETTDYCFVLISAHQIQSVTFDSCYGGGATGDELGWMGGIYLSNVLSAVLTNHYHTGPGVALVVDSTVGQIDAVGCFWQDGCTAAINSHRFVMASPKIIPGAGLPPSFTLQPSATAQRDLTVGGALAEKSFTLATAGVQSIGVSGATGLLVVADSEGRTGTFILKGTNNAVVEVNDPDTVYSHTKDNASTTNVYYDGGYKLQNNRPETRTYKILLLGSHLLVA